MPEGHTVHRIANQFETDFLGEVLEITSPQGRFAAAAKLISGHKLSSATAVGKQLFLYFSNDLVLRIHLGIFGKWQFHSKSSNPNVVGEVRARFVGSTVVADLRGPTVCEVIGVDEVSQVLDRLGPDPLNPDRKGIQRARFVSRVQKSNQPIGQLLMNQSVVSGIGNVYRAELLFRAGIEPHRPGSTITTDELEALWVDSVKLLRVGVRTGVMITREELFNKNPEKSDRNFVYKREGQPCRLCGTKISIELMQARKLYWCSGCQK